MWHVLVVEVGSSLLSMHHQQYLKLAIEYSQFALFLQRSFHHHHFWCVCLT